MKRFRNLAIIILMLVTLSFANTAGPNLPTAATGNTAAVFGGTRAWTNPTNIEANTANATVSFTGSQISDDLIATGFGFSIPSTATINGITISVSDISTSANVVTSGLKLLKAGAAVGTSKTTGTGNNWSTVQGTTTYGSGSDLWGTTWAPTDINASNFGAVMAAGSAAIDSAGIRNFQMTVTFTPAPGGCKGCFMPFLKSQTRTGSLEKVGL